MRQKTMTLAAFMAGAVVATSLIGLTGCEVNTRNDPAFVAASDHFVNKTVGPDYETYVQGDARLDDAQKEDRLQNVRTFRAAVEQAQLEIAETGG